MSKRSLNEIIRLVERHQRGETSQGAEAKILGVSQQTFRDCIRIYETFGESGFLSTERQHYSSELKLAAVKDYLSGGGSMLKYAKSTEFHQEHSYENGLGCIMVIKNSGLATAEEVISI